MAHAGGRPPLYKTPKDMQLAIDDYFNKCDSKIKKVLSKDGNSTLEINAPEPYTIAGLNYHLGFTTSNALADIAKDKEEFSDTITRARLRVESQRSGHLVNPDTRNSNGIKFDLTNNFGWKDKSETEVKFPDGIIIKSNDGREISRLNVESSLHRDGE